MKFTPVGSRKSLVVLGTIPQNHRMLEVGRTSVGHLVQPAEECFHGGSQAEVSNLYQKPFHQVTEISGY